VEPALSGIIGLVLVVLLNAFFNAARSTYSTVRRQSLKEAEEGGDQTAGRALAIAEDSLRTMTTFSLGSLLAHFIIASLIALLLMPGIAAWLENLSAANGSLLSALGFAIALLVAALLSYILTELIPEMLVHRNTFGWSRTLSGPARVTLLVLSPLVAFIAILKKLMAVPLGGDADAGAMFSEEEILTVVDASEEEGSIEPQIKEMIYKILQLDETLAREVMIPRIDIVALDIEDSLDEARQTIIENGHSRIPVYEEKLDQVRGLLYAKDLLELEDETAGLGPLLRPALFVPETKRVSELLRELQAAKVHMAIVVDEYGGTAGLVTIEDIVEEIVGEIQDEYDDEEEVLFEVTDQGFMVDARIDLDDFTRLTGIKLSVEHGEETLGGFIYARLGKVPDIGEIIDTDTLHIEVLQVIDQRIRKVRVEKVEASESEEGNGNASRKNNSSNGSRHG
jgi:CBS domain containing-hemolysin-like protein